MPGKKETKKAIEILKNIKSPGEDISGTKLLKKGGKLFVYDAWKLMKKL